MPELYAKIKKNSKYYNQNGFAKADGEFPFPVAIRKSGDGYVVKGGPGGQYRLADVNLFVKEGGSEIRIR